jgi:hypothetical protein
MQLFRDVIRYGKETLPALGHKIIKLIVITKHIAANSIVKCLSSKPFQFTQIGH